MLELEIPEIREIVPPVPPDTSWPLWIWLLIGVVAFALAAVAIILVAKSAKKPLPATAYDARDAALTKLHELKENYLGLPANEFALQASHGLIGYLAAHYGRTTPYETGREFLDRLDDKHLMSEQKHVVVHDLYDRAEALKYAPVPGADSQRLNLVQDMIAFVRDDTPGLQLTPNQTTEPDSDADPLPA